MKNNKKLYYLLGSCLTILLVLGLFTFQKVKSNTTDFNELKPNTELNENINNNVLDNTNELTDKKPNEDENPFNKEDNTDNKNQTAKPENNQVNNSTNSNNKPNNKPSNKPSNNTTTSSNTNNNNNTNNANNVVTPPTVDNPPVVIKPKTVDEIVSSMTLEEKIAQLLVISFNGTSFTNALQNDLNYKPGGVILFSNNISDFKNTTDLISAIQATSSLPLFISVDQEGGRVQRIKNISGKNITTIKPMWEIGLTNDVNTAYQTGRTIGSELKSFGINLDYAPVLDVVPDVNAGLIKDRSFGFDPYLVSKMGLQLAKGLSDTGIIPVYKHFPGHGATITDSHYALPVVTKSKDELLNSDLIPFKEAIKNGAKIIMIGHLAVPDITGSNIPASLSNEIINVFLKTELGYNGLVITDALNMKALTDNYSEKEIYEKAINAGVDILLMPKSVTSAINNIKNSVNEGRIPLDKINNSVRKIVSLKISSNL